MFRTALALTLALAGPAAATQEYILPTLFDVTGVAADDELNVRAEPDAGATILDTIPHDAKGIEVVHESRGWGRVNTDQVSGWVSMRFLSYRTDVWQPGELPAGFRCLGTEPFWNLSPDGSGMVLRSPENEGGDRRPVQAVLDTGVFRDPSRVVVAGDMTLFSHPQMCSDGMSDRLFGLSATVVLHGQQPRMLSGCCLIQP